MLHLHTGVFQGGLGFFNLGLRSAVGQQKRQRTVKENFQLNNGFLKINLNVVASPTNLIELRTQLVRPPA